MVTRACYTRELATPIWGRRSCYTRGLSKLSKLRGHWRAMRSVCDTLRQWQRRAGRHAVRQHDVARSGHPRSTPLIWWPNVTAYFQIYASTHCLKMTQFDQPIREDWQNPSVYMFKFDANWYVYMYMLYMYIYVYVISINAAPPMPIVLGLRCL
jgi:hypothetical protein